MKNVPWFSHDFNARDDEKILIMRMTHGWNAYGLYWAIIEMLRASENYKLQTQYDSIAYALQTDREIIRSIIESFDLFVVDGTTFYSKSLVERMLIKDEKSAEASKSAKIRWEKYRKNQQVNADALQTHSECNANAMLIKVSKVKVNKEKIIKNKEYIAPSFEEFKKYCIENGFESIAERAYKYYSEAEWKDSQGNQVKVWKSKLQAVWFKPENKNQEKKQSGVVYNAI